MSVRISKKRDYRPHAEALHGARVLLNMSANQPKGCHYLWMGSLLLSAFAFEGYLNFLGRVLFPSWELFERTLSWQGKVNLLGDRVGFVADEGCEPFQTVKLLFKFRDRMAHPKPQELTEEYVKSPEKLTTPLEMYKHVKSEEEKFCSEANAKLCSERVYEMMEFMNLCTNMRGKNLRRKILTKRIHLSSMPRLCPAVSQVRTALGSR